MKTLYYKFSACGSESKGIPVSTGTISKSVRQYLNNIPGNYEIKELRKAAALGTAHTVRKVLM